MNAMMKAKFFVLFLTAAVILITVPSVLHAAGVDINGSVQVNGSGNQIIFPDASTQRGTVSVKFIIALTGIFPNWEGDTTYSEQMIGEIRMFAGFFVPAGWALCDGRLLLINDYAPLFSLLGTTYGGDGQTTFALPNLNNRAPVGF